MEWEAIRRRREEKHGVIVDVVARRVAEAVAKRSRIAMLPPPKFGGREIRCGAV